MVSVGVIVVYFFQVVVVQMDMYGGPVRRHRYVYGGALQLSNGLVAALVAVLGLVAALVAVPRHHL
jgi:hypothetical protein